MADYNSSLPVRTENAGDVIAKIADATVPSQQLAITAAGEAKVEVTQPLPAGSNTIGSVGVTNLPTTVSTNNGATDASTLRTAANLAIGGADVTALNPVPVTIETAAGSPVDDYKDATSIAVSASDNHDYTVTALKTLSLTQIEASASGKAKMTVAIETGVGTGIFTTKWTQFNSTAETNMSIKPTSGLTVAAGVKVRVTLTNLDKAAQDLYSTISGKEA